MCPLVLLLFPCVLDDTHTPNLPRTCTLSFGAGCYGNHRHVPSRSSLDRAGNCDTVGIGSESPTYSHCGSMNTPPGGRRDLVLERESRRQTTEVLYTTSRAVVFISDAEGDNEQLKSQR